MERKTTRKQFYFEALKLFHEKGFKATSMRDIAEKLDIKAATLYNYIDSKHEILEVLLFEVANKFKQGIEDISLSTYSPTEKLKAVIGLNVRLTVEFPYQISLLVSEWKHLNDEKKADFLANRNGYEAKLREIIQEGMKQGELRPMNLEIAMQAILSSIRWLFTWYSVEKDLLNPVELEKQMVDFILSGVGSPHQSK